ncbi:DUF6786 family protein [Allorhodopirellula solitaria]|uniref:Lipoprotein n=1 Tax=Allorhodopirellula solitaria TaxID=2527987 RepID=A0A5C5X222_9BACT|nr:DUF6786 family protein [Allorhodopirellula solitaria]TWT56215.1 hypothetical protein CA85_43970 [Allorhodopirellula solitaria]
MNRPYALTLAVLLSSLLLPQATRAQSGPESSMTTFQADYEFLREHTNTVLLEREGAAVVLVPDYQGRVMTSTVDRESGPSFGWINRPVIEKGLLSEAEREGQLEEHIYIFGGEERFWLGPEGGQFALFFKPGTSFEFADWSTPPAIDTEPFELVQQTKTTAKFERDCEITNFSNTTFQMGIERTVRLLDQEAIAESLRVSQLPAGVHVVAYESDNRLTNIGTEAWTVETGMPSIWLLGMYNPSPQTTIVVPFRAGNDSSLGPKVNDSYFGEVPPEHLSVEDDVLFFKGDGTRRGKIGISPQRSLGIAGSYDAEGEVLTVVTYNVPTAPLGYVNSMWEFQDEPFQGDAINAYNDGSPAPGEPPLGPFYELETSSPAAALGPGETLKHVQRTIHVQGAPGQLNPISERLLGVSIDEINHGIPPGPNAASLRSQQQPGRGE